MKSAAVGPSSGRALRSIPWCVFCALLGIFMPGAQRLGKGFEYQKCNRPHLWVKSASTGVLSLLVLQWHSSAWGSIFYAHGVFKAALEAKHGWSGLMLSSAQAWFWAVGALTAFGVGAALRTVSAHALSLVMGLMRLRLALRRLGWS